MALGDCEYFCLYSLLPGGCGVRVEGLGIQV